MKTIMPTLPNPDTMTQQERKEEAKELLARLKALRTTPRSDWHREFERILREEARPYGADVSIRAEEELGIDPPRVDYLILDDRKRLMRQKDIFAIFRQHNVVEYKNPHDSLNMRVISKAVGYANFYIGLAERDGERPRNEVTVSIFRAVRNHALFDEMMANGTLVPTETTGIYHVKNLTDLPFQIVITGELKGDEYATYRVLTDNAAEEDVALIARVGAEEDAEARELRQKLLEFVDEKNPGLLSRLKGDEQEMSSRVLEIFKPEIDERINEAVSEAVGTSRRNDLYDYVHDGDMRIENAAKRAGISVAQFQQQMNEYIHSRQMQPM